MEQTPSVFVSKHARYRIKKHKNQDGAFETFSNFSCMILGVMALESRPLDYQHNQNACALLLHFIIPFAKLLHEHFRLRGLFDKKETQEGG